MDKPRHFKLKVTTFDSTLFRLFFNSFVTPNIFKNDEQLEVIEYSAYEQLKKENTELKITASRPYDKADRLFESNKNLLAAYEQLKKENYSLRCEMLSYINKVVAAEFHADHYLKQFEQLKSKLKVAKTALDHYSCSYQQIILTGPELAQQALKEIES